ncbi:MAG: Xaa-Pro peptidase family protein [Actinobacteria bacterium]|nr:Xaa-Pro peptidase family protein [Actinomycetota bacterium]MCL5986997.1 Xaa-Pro peptidase family protein [Actinomycetota bacterium]
MATMPKDEFEKRIAKVVNLIQDKGVEAVFIYFNELFIYNGRYLTDWHPTVEQGAVLVTEAGKYCVLCGPEAGPGAKFDSMITETRNLSCFMVPEEEYPGAYISSFKEVFEEFVGKSEIKKLGIAGLEGTPYGIIKSIQDELQKVELVDLTSEYERLRAVKSIWEIENIKTAYKIADEATKAIMLLIKSGIREYEVAAAGEYAARKMGANGFGYQTIIGTGDRVKGIVPVASNHKYESGEITTVGISPRYNGYNATAAQTYVVDGKWTNEFKDYMNIVAEALFLTKSNIKIGNVGKDIDKITRGFIKNKGLGEYSIMPYLHSTGLCEYEIPFFGPNSNDVIQENMVLCVDLSLFNHPKFPGTRIETGWIVRKYGPEPLSTFMESQFKY